MLHLRNHPYAYSKRDRENKGYLRNRVFPKILIQKYKMRTLAVLISSSKNIESLFGYENG